MIWSGDKKNKVDNDKLKAVMKANTSQTMHELGAMCDVTIPTILNYLKRISKVMKLDRWVPHELNERQKRNRFSFPFFTIVT